MAFSNEANGKLLETQTADGLRLHGFFQQPIALQSSTDPSVEKINGIARSVWLIVHGVAGNFYNSSLLSSIAVSLLSAGNDVLRINTRGRDAISYISVGATSSRCGAAYETISDSVSDISAWVDLLRKENYQSINVLGHSLGAVKSLLFACQTSEVRDANPLVQSSSDSSSFYVRQTKGSLISRLVLLSPPRLQSETLRRDIKYASSYNANLTEAQHFCDSGKPEALLTIRFPQPMIVSAATYLDKYGPESRYDFDRFITNVPCPTLWCFGEHEVRGPRASFQDSDKYLLEKISTLKLMNQTVKIIPRGDHAYTGVRELLSESVISWTQATV